MHCLYYVQTWILQWYDLFRLSLYKISARTKETLLLSSSSLACKECIAHIISLETGYVEWLFLLFVDMTETVYDFCW